MVQAIHKSALILTIITLLIKGIGHAQTGCNPDIQFHQLGSASNIQTILNSRLHPLAYDSASNTLVFIHRNDVSVFGGTSGQLRYDISSDSGTTWTLDQGLLNPVTYATNPGRFPQVSIYNPGDSSNSDDSYLMYYAATTNGFVYTGYVSGSRQLNGALNSEFVNQAGVAAETYIPGGMCQGAPGIFWTVDAKYDYATSTYSGFRIFKGSWDGTDVVWSLNKEIIPDFNLSYNGKAQVADWNMAFDPSGMNGWAVFLTHLNGGSSMYQYHPVFYHTDDGGITWNGPIQIELDSFPEVTSIVTPGSFPTTAYQVGITVDINGNPHAFLNVGSGDGTNYKVDSTTLYMFHITYDGVDWKATNISKVDGLRGYLGPTSAVWHDNEPQCSRSKDGSMLAFLWTDTEDATGDNNAPDLYAAFYYVPLDSWSPVVETTSCTDYTGKILWPRTATELISIDSDSYKIPLVFGQLNASGNDLDPATFLYIDQLNFTLCDVLGAPIASITANDVPPFCEGDSVLLQAATDSLYSFQWQLNGTDIVGATTDSLWVNESGLYTLKVFHSNGCEATDEMIITVNPLPVLTIQATGATTICSSDSVVLFTLDSGYVAYNWQEDGVSIPDATGLSYSASPAAEYALIATDSIGCSGVSNFISVNSLTNINIFIAGLEPGYCISDSDALLEGFPAGGVFSGAIDTGNIFSPSQLGLGTFVVSYSFVDSMGCVNIASDTTTVYDLPIITASNDTSTCAGIPIQLFVNGAATYEWLPADGLSDSLSNQPIALPEITTTYIVTGTSSAGCSDTAAVTIAVNPLPEIYLGPDTTICNDDSLTLNAGEGFSSYLWSTEAMTSSIIVNTENNYSINVTDSNGCVGNDTILVMVEICDGVGEIEDLNGVKVYPNPTSGKLNLEFKTQIENATIIIYDIIGKQLMEEHITVLTGTKQFTLDVSELNTGTYLVSVLFDDLQHLSKITIGEY